MNGAQQLVCSTLCPLGLPRKKAHEASQSYAQKEAQNDHPQRISYLLVGNFLPPASLVHKCNTSRIHALGWLEKKEEKR